MNWAVDEAALSAVPGGLTGARYVDHTINWRRVCEGEERLRDQDDAQLLIFGCVT